MIGLALAGGGCGKSSDSSPNDAELALERAQFAQIVDGLGSAQPSVEREVAASRIAWHAIAGGLPSPFPSSLRRDVTAASIRAGALSQPPFLASVKRLTGPASGVAALYESFARLAERGWRLTDASMASIASGSPADARFARENSSLYIDSIYDAHFDLSLIGKSVVKGYEQLGGASAFDAKLTHAEIHRLAGAYSIPAVRLAPHPAPSIESP
ncbi:MAG: hypothetical protein ACTHM1_01355 [Solirubrobacteraceae bacterium]